MRDLNAILFTKQQSSTRQWFLEKVPRCAVWYLIRFILCRCCEDFLRPIEFFIESQYRCDIAAPVAVVWSRPHRHKFVLKSIQICVSLQDLFGRKHVLESLLNKLMCSADQFQTVDAIEFGSNLLSEQPSRASRADSPCVNLLGIAPH